MKKTSLITVCAVLLLTTFTLQAQQAEDNYNPFLIYAAGNYHLEARDYVGHAAGFDILTGIDFLVWKEAGLYLGPRLGWYTETVCTAYMGPELAMYQKPSLGAQVYFVYPSPFIKALQGIAGLASDALFNLDEMHGQEGEPIYLFTSAFLGIRYIFAKSIYLEGRLEAGTFPFFDAPPTFLKFGMQAGIQL